MNIDYLKKISASVLGTSLLAVTLFSSTAEAANTYKVDSQIDTYISTTDAKLGRNKVGVYTKGEYYIYSEYDGYINITRTKGEPGAWVKPSYDYKDETNSNLTKFEIEESVNVRSQQNSSVVSYKNTGEIISGKVVGDWVYFNENGKDLKVHVSYTKEVNGIDVSLKLVKDSVNVRSQDTNEVVGYKASGEIINGKKVGEWILFTENGKNLKVHASFIGEEEVLSLQVIEPVNVRDENLNLIGYFKSGDKFYGYKDGRYYVFYNNGIRKVWDSFVQKINEEITEEYNVRSISTPTPSTNYLPSSTSITKSSSSSVATESKATTESKSTTSSNILSKVEAGARAQLGLPYVWGGSSPSVGFDCSGLTSYVLREYAGISIPRSASSQYNVGTAVSKSELQVGDLVFFGSGSVEHVGIYVGNNNIIHAPDFGRPVEETSLSNSWYRNNYLGARRFIK